MSSEYVMNNKHRDWPPAKMQTMAPVGWYFQRS